MMYIWKPYNVTCQFYLNKKEKIGKRKNKHSKKWVINLRLSDPFVIRHTLMRKLEILLRKMKVYHTRFIKNTAFLVILAISKLLKIKAEITINWQVLMGLVFMIIERCSFESLDMLGDEKCYKIIWLLNYLIFYYYACDSCHIKHTYYKWIPSFVYIAIF